MNPETSSAALPVLFDKHELRRLRSELPNWLSDAQQKRVKEALALVGGYPLMRRLRAALEADRVPMSDGDWQLLGRLPVARNRTVHGAKVDLVAAEDIDLGCGLLSRALVHRMTALAEVPA